MNTENDGVAIVRNGHRTLFKWHRGRKQLSDIPFTAARILEGLRLGASVEVDINCHRDNGFVVLHNKTLDMETSGTGPLGEVGPEELRKLTLRREDGTLSKEPVLLLEDLLGILAREPLPPSALLQLDLKEDVITSGLAAAFGPHAAPVARHLIVSGGEYGAVTRLAGAAPGIAIGFDPCHDDSAEHLRQTGDFGHFIAEGLARGAGASMIYLDYRIVVMAAKSGFDMVDAVHAAGKTVDAWTLNSTRPDAAEALQILLDLKVDQITSDEPVYLQQLARSSS